MIIWRGFGILGVLVPFIFGGILQWLFGGDSLYAGIGYIIGSIPFWFWGRKWNANSYIAPDLDSFGNWVNKEHTAFFIPIQYFVFVFIAIGIAVTIPGEKGRQLLDLLLTVWAIYIGAVLLYFLYLRIKNPIAFEKYVKPMFVKSTKSKKKSHVNKKTNIVKQGKAFSKRVDYSKPTIEREKLKDFKESDHSRFIPNSKKDSSEAE